MKQRTRRRARWLAAGLLIGVLCILAAGCGGDDEPDAAEPGTTAAETSEPAAPEGMLETLGEGEGEVNLIAWAGYVEDGTTDPKVDWVSDFEQETGCQVNVKLGNTSDEMVTLMRTGQYDGVSASGDASLRLIAGGDVAPVNTELIENYEGVFEGLKDQPHNTVDDVTTASRMGAARTCSSTAPTRSSRLPTAGASSGTRTRPTRAR